MIALFNEFIIKLTKFFELNIKKIRTHKYFDYIIEQIQ